MNKSSLNVYVLVIICYCVLIDSASHPKYKTSKYRNLEQTNFDVLSKFYMSLNGSNWFSKSNWLTNAPCPTGGWYGVECISTSIGSLDFQKNNLQGSIPSEIGLLSALHTIVLTFNNITGWMPSEIGQINKNMDAMFKITSNSITGPIPSQLGQLSLLTRRFKVYSNSFSSSIPSQLGLLTSMTKHFSLNSNRLSGRLPSQLGQLTIMTEYFWIQSNSLSYSIPSELGKLTAMVRYLSLKSNSFSGSMPSQIGQLTAMKRDLYINSNSISGSLPSQLGLLKILSNNVYFSSNLFCDEMPSELIALTSSLSDYDIITSNSFGTPCCTSLPIVYTCSPTASPTKIPSNVPTILPSLTPLPTTIPTPSPTQTPSILPFPLPTSIPTTDPTSLPTNTPNPSGVPSIAPTPTPSNLPSPLPSSTFIPTASPTLRPTPLPTFIPILRPTPLPTLIPTSTPTPLPTIPPTTLPTVSVSPTTSPTYQPTTVPTFPPTVVCSSGSYFDGFECRNCLIGHFSNFSYPPYPSNCTLCPAGQYAAELGADSCLDCAIGKLSSTDRTSCQYCNAGEYANDNECVRCEVGRYAPQPLSDQCLTCSSGSYTNNLTKATTCTSCNAGYYSSDVTDTCLHCPVGKFSSSQASQCSDCSIGFVAPTVGSAACFACSAGSFAQNESSSNCSACVAGKYQGSTSQGFCEVCEVGKYSSEPGATLCAYCEVGTTSAVGSASCDSALENYYFSSTSRDEVMSCPKNANCLGKAHSPIPNKGYWVDRSDYAYAGIVYKCSRETCKGVTNDDDECWTISGFNDSECVGTKQCLDGAEGPLCGACSIAYVYQPASAVCVPCREANVLTYFIIGLFLLVMLGILFSFHVYQTVRELLLNLLQYFDSGSFKVIWVTFQIIVSSSVTLNVKFPGPFSGMLGFLSIFSFDFLALECLSTGRQDKVFYDTVYLWCFIPFLVAIYIIVIGFIRILHLKKSSAQTSLSTPSPISLLDMEPILQAPVSSNKKKQRAILNQHIWMLLFLSYVILPPVVNKQLQIFDCVSIQSGESYVWTDTSISCQGNDYLQFRSIIVIFIWIYQIIPILWYFLLYQNKQWLMPPTVIHDEKFALFIRDQNPKLASIRFLFIDYKCNKWWFEIADMYRRIMYIGIVPLVSHSAVTRASFGMLLSILSVVYFSQQGPYRVPFTNTIAFVAQITILVTYYAALSIESIEMTNFGLEGQRLGLFLVLVNFTVVTLSFWIAFKNFRTQQKTESLRIALSQACERAVGLNYEEKLLPMLDEINIEADEVLVYYYCSSVYAKQARKSGLIALKAFQGVPFTLRRPHETTQLDFALFRMATTTTNDNNNLNQELELYPENFPHEEVLVLSLPKEFLEPLPGYEDDDGLCMISVEILNAFRPSCYNQVVDPRPWLQSLVILPPHCILHSFLIISDSEKIISDPLDLSIKNQDDDWKVYETQPIVYETRVLKQITNSKSYIKEMIHIREKANQLGQMPLYIYTSIIVADLTKHGIPVVTNPQFNQEDIVSVDSGGVYLSTKSPISYEFGTKNYEINIIKDFYGAEYVHKLKGKGNFDVVLIYGCTGQAIERVHNKPNLRRFAASKFRKFSLMNDDNIEGTYLLRPDRILGGFDLINNLNFLTNLSIMTETNERFHDSQNIKRLNLFEDQRKLNGLRIIEFVSLFNTINVMKKTEKKDAALKKKHKVYQNQDEHQRRAVISSVVGKRYKVRPMPSQTL